MKTNWLRVVVLGVGLFSLVVGGCSNNDGGGDGTTGVASGKITVDGILFNPKAPAPGDTMKITAVVSGESAPGDYVKYAWTATGGKFIENGLTTVRWSAPDTSTAFEITVQASNSASTSTLKRMIFVSTVGTVVTSGAGEMHLTPADDKLFFLGSSTPPGEGFSGTQVRLANLSGGWTNVTARRGSGYRFDLGPENAAHMELRTVDFVVTVWHDDLLTGSSEELPTTPFTFRPPAFAFPELSPDGNLIAYSGLLPDQEKFPAQGGVDTFRVYTYDVAAQTAQQVALQSGTRNWMPMFSPDGNNLVFVSNRNVAQGWELWSLPVQGGQVVPDTTVAPTMLTDTGGIMASGSAPPSLRKRQWNPNPANPILAILDTGNKLRLVRADGGGAVFVNVAGTATDFAWTNDGEKLAMITAERDNNNIIEVTKTGTTRPLLSVASSDRLEDVAWSADGELLVYAVTRSGSMWYEVMDVGGATGLTAPVAITPAFPRGNADDYASIMFTRPVWEHGRRLVYLLFFNGFTPRIVSVGLQGL